MLKESPAEQLGAPHALGNSSMGQKGLIAIYTRARGILQHHSQP